MPRTPLAAPLTATPLAAVLPLVAALLTASLGASLAAPDARAQSMLEAPAVFAPVVGLSTVPDHGDAAVSFLDYRDGGYQIMVAGLGGAAPEAVASVFFAEPEVATFGARVAWVGYTSGGQPDVYLHDRSAGTTAPITSDAAFQNHPDLSGGTLVWQDYRNAGTSGRNADIYAYDLATTTETALTTDAAYQDLPKVSGRRVVWQDFRHAGAALETAEIYLYDLDSGQERRLTNGSAYRTRPAVAGEIVVWEDYRGGAGGDIYLYDLAAGQERPVSTHEAHQEQPVVYGDWVVWLDYRNSQTQADLYGYHLGTGEEYALLVEPAHQDAPALYDGHLVWQDYRDGRFDLYAGTLASPVGTAVETEAAPSLFRLAATPNPSSGPVTLTVSGAPSAAALGAGAYEAGAYDLAAYDVAIYDVLGRLVTRRALEPGALGAVQLVWDGRSAAGVPVGPGLYVALVRGSAPAGSAPARVVLVRTR